MSARIAEQTMENRQDQEGKGMPGKIALVFSVLTHVLLLAPVLYIVALYFKEYTFFSWHPICMAVGVGLLMMEAVFTISGEGYLSSKLSRGNRVTLHWILNASGLSLMLIGLIIIVVNKNRHGWNHFVTSHAKLGLSSIIIAIVVAIFGILANNTRWLYPHVRPVLVKVGHAFGGIAITILLLATIINGTYKNSFPGSETGRSLVFAALFIAGVFIIVKPCLGAVARSRVLFKRSKTTSDASDS
ncbi:transmembrane reductase CYB561D2-like isoform X2 [Venturia canescens]|uniref:transmembrane reductase CYB561D2-like isoform X2 n=1 Tax=Venturia canescens TaxID=32260 RepID=UPI001C9C4BF7|nr:transmembrane reductase CYB561D2-like isoform X2 [Venturia canescens]